MEGSHPSKVVATDRTGTHLYQTFTKRLEAGIPFIVGWLPGIADWVCSTWRIIPFSKWLLTMVSKSPNWGWSSYKWPNFMAYNWGLLSRDGPPSRGVLKQPLNPAIWVHIFLLGKPFPSRPMTSAPLAERKSTIQVWFLDDVFLMAIS